MSKESREQMFSFLKKITDLDYVHPEDITEIELYMDQVTSFMDSNLQSVKRHPEDKTLTKNMINNYTKHHVLPAPVKKKYSRDHVLTLIMIYYLKSFLSISDIEEILKPIDERFFGQDKDINFADIYEELVKMETEEIDVVISDIMKKYKLSQKFFKDHEFEDQEEEETLHQFAMICNLSFDIYLKKMLIETMVDDMIAARESSASDKNRKN
ncbi:MAG: DUF1836 domain-containing protein [Lachnospiraceae bacterium]|nr:DUF1836 domain-containing protein [Lachnospiraceae bacterium]